MRVYGSAELYRVRISYLPQEYTSCMEGAAGGSSSRLEGLISDRSLHLTLRYVITYLQFSQ